MSDLIDRQMLKADLLCGDNTEHDYCFPCREILKRIDNQPSAQPEPAIPLQWIEARIEWLKSLDNAFSTLTAVQISAMVNKWKDEQDG
jgi:hypothetical protein